jgi:hypothetical protein
MGLSPVAQTLSLLRRDSSRRRARDRHEALQRSRCPGFSPPSGNRRTLCGSPTHSRIPILDTILPHLQLGSGLLWMFWLPTKSKLLNLVHGLSSKFSLASHREVIKLGWNQSMRVDQ